MTEKIKPMNWLLGLAGAVGGGTVGYFLFVWLVQQGFYGMVIPGAALGAGGGFLLKGRSRAFGIVCGMLSVFLGIFAEWRTAPFRDDKSFGYFLAHLHQLTTVTFIMIALGALCGYWFGQGQERIGRTREGTPGRDN
jgi:hypothetical protein